MSETTTAPATEKITCMICGATAHAMAIHLRDSHEGYTIEKYQAEFPGAPLMSAACAARLEAKRKQEEAARRAMEEQEEEQALIADTTAMPLSELFGIEGAGTKKPDGSPIMVERLGSTEWDMQVPDKIDSYVFDVEMLKVILMGTALNIPTYMWGHAGTGKTSLIEQTMNRLNRPSIRIQHTGSTEESHILGSMAASPERGTYFEPGPLPLAMKYGWTYLADEYDFAFPQVLAVYQPVLEGKALVIKEAPADSGWRVIRPHPNFRFMATGNTNGTGDATGLYGGTNVQNAANYERFGIVEKMPYMDAETEAAIISAQTNIKAIDAKRLVKFATLVREAYDAKRIAATIGPRALINAAQVGVARASFMKGLNSAFLNRLRPKDQEICLQLAQRVLS